MNCDKPSGSITLYSIKIQKIFNYDSDSDDGKKKGKVLINTLDYKFGFIKEMKLILSNSI